MSDKIKVEFDLDVKDVLKLIESGSQEKSISQEALNVLSKEGPIKASELLDEKQIIQVSAVVTKSLAMSVSKISVLENSRISVLKNSRITQRMKDPMQNSRMKDSLQNPRIKDPRITEMQNPRGVNIHNIKDPDKPIK